MDDIKAIAILSEQIQTLRTAPEPPKNIDDGENYGDRIQRMLEEVTTEVKRVAAYVEQVEKKLQELVNSQLVLVKKNQDALQTLFADFQFNTIVSGNVVKGGKPSAVDKLQLAHEIEKTSRAIMNDRLNELVKGTEVVLAKLKDGAELYKEDMENLKGCLKDWKNSKAYEKRKQKQERREMEKREKEEQKKQKEEERRKRQKEEADRKAEEDRRKREDKQRKRDAEEQRKLDEIERKKRETEEKKKKEDEEKRGREQMELNRKAEEERRRTEAEEKRLREEMEMQRQEQMEKQIREWEEWKLKEEERKKREQTELDRRAEEEIMRGKAEEKRKLEEEEKKRQNQIREEEERKLKEDEERRKRKQKELDRKVEEEKKRLEAEEKRKRVEEEKRRQKQIREEEERKIKKQKELDRRAEEERRRLEAEGKRKREAEEKRRQEQIREEEERKHKIYEERRKRELEEIDRMAEEERLRIEAEEQMQREEEEKRRQEFVKRQIMEEKQRKLKEEERKKREREEADRKAKEEQARLEKERLRKERERLKLEQKTREEIERKRSEDEERQIREAEEMAWREDTNNWETIVYDRACDEVDGRRAYHDGIACIVTTPPGEIERKDISCSGHDEVNSIIEILQPDEKPASSIIEVTSLNQTPVQTQIPARIYIPQISVVNRKYETVLKVSIDGSDWVEFLPLEPISNLIEYVRNVEKINGFQVNNFTSIKAFAVNRPRSETIVVDKPGASVRSSMDKHVKLFVVREAFLSRTELQLSVQKFSEKNIEVIVKENTDFRHIHGVTTVITLTCQTPPRKPIEIDISKPHRKQESEAHKHYTSYKLNTMTGECWRFAEVECIRHHEDTTVVLPNGKDKYIVTVLEMPSSLPTGNVPYIAEELYKCVYKTVVKMIVKQNIECPEQCVVRIVGRDECKETLAFLSENGYTEGPEVSAEFCVTEGQRLQICFEGNIETVEQSDRRIEMTYLSYMRGARTQTTLRVKDRGNQKELPAYVGAVKCTVLEIKPEGINYTKTVTLNVALPKQAGTRTVISYTEVRLPYYFTALVNFVSQHLFNKNQNAWRNVLKTLDKAKFQPVHRKAKGKFAENDEKQLCKAMLLHWMKTQTVHVDMLNSVVEALKHNGHLNIAEACVEYVEFQKEYLSDDVLTDLADGKSKDSQTLGEELGLTKTVVDSCIQANVNNKEQLTAIMMEWRETDDVILYGDTALDHLQQLCV